jgi:hypothetical protein
MDRGQRKELASISSTDMNVPTPLTQQEAESSSKPG